MYACKLFKVEYQFSDINLVANEFLLKIMNKDTEGYGVYVAIKSELYMDAAAERST